MKRFELYHERLGRVGEGVLFSNGTIAVSQGNKDSLFNCLEEYIRCVPYTVKWVDPDIIPTVSSSPFDRGRMDCLQDTYENTPFASIGGLGCRRNFQRPEYIEESELVQYFRGYAHQAWSQYSHDWRDCEFQWKPALNLDSANAQ